MKTFTVGNWFIGIERTKGTYSIHVETPKPAIYSIPFGIIKSLSLHNNQWYDMVLLSFFGWLIIIHKKSASDK